MPKKKLQKYTVVLQYPSSISDGVETYMAHVSALNPVQAITKAKKDACKKSGYLGEPSDFTTLCTFTGHLIDWSPL
jgi:hypothetical protein